MAQLNLTIEKMKHLEKLLQARCRIGDNIIENIAQEFWAPDFQSQLKMEKEILAGIESAIIHAEME